MATSRIILLIGLVATMALGASCRSNSQMAVPRHGHGVRPESREVLREGEVKIRDLQTWVLFENLRKIDDRRISPDELDEALLQVSRMPVIEGPEWWTRIVNDEGYTPDHRRDCIIAFFRRYVRPGMRLGRLFEIPGVSGWFSSETLSKMGAGEGNLPLEDRGECVYLFKPEFLPRTPSRYFPTSSAAVFFSLTKYVSEDDMSLVRHGMTGDQGTKILEISSSPGDLLEDLQVSKRRVVPGAAFRKFQ
jgi:hypothetical protein